MIVEKSTLKSELGMVDDKMGDAFCCSSSCLMVGVSF